ncbi:hypothetical protein BDP27DRAFT_1373546 [Rhodocollybia butyracea]|uniref:Uncharacterized protein n=1 Tax=Rhodocollybia butyracea TaxID=206335 RepID=A0A9P5TWJ6_9AGAR|nr:hypothetical protein BDP27DRAFT_1373546 [Rhodocollybia butyracea]
MVLFDPMTHNPDVSSDVQARAQGRAEDFSGPSAGTAIGSGHWEYWVSLEIIATQHTSFNGFYIRNQKGISSFDGTDIANVAVGALSRAEWALAVAPEPSPSPHITTRGQIRMWRQQGINKFIEDHSWSESGDSDGKGKEKGVVPGFPVDGITRRAGPRRFHTAADSMQTSPDCFRFRSRTPSGPYYDPVRGN